MSQVLFSSTSFGMSLFSSPSVLFPPAPRNCVINKDELQDGLRVLIPMDDKLLYAGHVSTVHSPDM